MDSYVPESNSIHVKLAKNEAQEDCLRTHKLDECLLGNMKHYYPSLDSDQSYKYTAKAFIHIDEQKTLKQTVSINQLLPESADSV